MLFSSRNNCAIAFTPLKGGNPSRMDVKLTFAGSMVLFTPMYMLGYDTDGFDVSAYLIFSVTTVLLVPMGMYVTPETFSGIITAVTLWFSVLMVMAPSTMSGLKTSCRLVVMASFPLCVDVSPMFITM